ncbi:hypothetical protein EI541_22200, partial [Xanthomonas citri pv. eucalyptorum]
VNRGIPTESARNGEIPKIQTPLFGTMRHAALSDLFVQTFPRRRGDANLHHSPAGRSRAGPGRRGIQEAARGSARGYAAALVEQGDYAENVGGCPWQGGSGRRSSAGIGEPDHVDAGGRDQGQSSPDQAFSELHAVAQGDRRGAWIRYAGNRARARKADAGGAVQAGFLRRDSA